MLRYDITPYINSSPQDVRSLIRQGKISFPTAGICSGYAQANLVILPREYSDDFKEYTKLNPFSCPVLEIVEGSPITQIMAKDGNIVTDIPEYYVYKNGIFHCKCNDASEFWQDGFVGFLIGCSFSFEEALINAGIEMRHISTGRNVPMYKTNIPTVKCGVFEGPTVCSMRPMIPENAKLAKEITSEMPNVHGSPIHIGDPSEIGILNINKPDYGESVEIKSEEVPVFWPCGVTPQAAVENAKPPIVITHSPGYMFITDVKNSELNNFINRKKQA